MYKNLYELCQYAKEAGRLSALELPLEMKDEGITDLLSSRFESYKSLLISFLDYYNLEDVKHEYLPFLEELQDCIMKILSYGLSEYSSFKETLDKINNQFDLVNRVSLDINNNQEFYRLCSYKENLKEAKEFYHCPITSKDNNIATRFGTKDDFLWYLGYTRLVCIECEARKKTACMALFRMKPNESLRVLDLTQGELFSEKNLKTKSLCYIFWWLIACCYCGYDKFSDDHNTYTIPQLFSKYLKENYPSIDGIKYYTVRNAQLNPDENTYVNVAFFTRNYNEEGYDMDLCGKFEMISSEQNINIRH